VKVENSVKIFGPDLATLESIATKIRAAMWKVRGIVDIAIFDALGQPALSVDIDRPRAHASAWLQATSMRRSRPESGAKPHETCTSPAATETSRSW
jgi:hypothetical protein